MLFLLWVQTSREGPLAEEVDELPFQVLQEDLNRYDPRTERTSFPERDNLILSHHKSWNSKDTNIRIITMTASPTVS